MSMDCTTVMASMASLLYVVIDQSKSGKEITEDTSVSLDLTCKILSLFHHHEKEKPIRPMGCEKYFINCNIIPTARWKTSSGMM